MKPIYELLGFTFAWLVLIVGTLGLGLLLIPLYWALVVRNSDARLGRAEEKLKATLMPHEKVLGWALQKRLRSLTSRRTLLAVTNSRAIMLERSLLGGFNMADYQWKDLKDAHLHENILPQYFGSAITLEVERKGSGAQVHAVDGIDSSVASSLYAEAQTQEQAWEEKRRVRELEEKRAASGGISLAGGGLPSGSASQAGGGTLEELERAKNLFDAGAISDAEYQEIKSKILSRPGY